jgi:hypothetical protein
MKEARPSRADTTPAHEVASDFETKSLPDLMAAVQDSHVLHLPFDYMEHSYLLHVVLAFLLLSNEIYEWVTLSRLIGSGPLNQDSRRLVGTAQEDLWPNHNAVRGGYVALTAGRPCGRSRSPNQSSGLRGRLPMFSSFPAGG